VQAIKAEREAALLKLGSSEQVAAGDEDASDVDSDEGVTSPLTTEEAFYWTVFGVLNGQRVQGEHGPNPITLADINACVAMYSVDSVDVPTFLRLVLSLDRLYLEITYARLEEETKARNRKSKQKARR
jgi:hypothetical protein